jgi:hypothetical protein
MKLSRQSLVPLPGVEIVAVGCTQVDVQSTSLELQFPPVDDRRTR